MSKMVALIYRSGSPAYWSGFILPLGIFLAQPSWDIWLVLGPLVLNTIFIMFLYKSEKDVLSSIESLRIPYVLLSIGWFLLSEFYYNEDWYKTFTNIMLFCIYPYVFYNAIRYYPKSFTLGEGLIVTQAFLYTFWACVEFLPSYPEELKLNDELRDGRMVSCLVQTGFLGVMLATRIMVIASKPWAFLFTEELFCVWGKCSLVGMFFRLSSNDIWDISDWIVEFFSLRTTILAYWVACVVGSLGIVFWKNHSGIHASTSDRKLFHFLILLVYLPGVIKYRTLLYLASAAVMYVFVLFELIRFLRFQIFGTNLGEIIDQSVDVFRDNQDEGKLIITPIYLLAGCSVPVWLLGPNTIGFSEFKIAGSLAGLLSIGVGDTFASIGGTYFQGPKWRGSSKSASGTACCIVSQLLFIGAISMFNWFTFSGQVFVTMLMAIIVNSFVESITDQIDNLVLPIVTFDIILAGEILFKAL